MSAPKYPNLCRPLTIRGFTLKNRLEASNSLPHFLKGPEPYPAESVIAHYANKARSAGIVTCMGINNFTRGKQMPMDMDFGHFPDFDLYDTNCQNYLLQLADNIHYFDSIACMAIFVGPPSAYPLMRVKEGSMERPYSAFDQLTDKTKVVISTELSMGQLIEDVRLGVQGRFPVKLIHRTGGMLPTSLEIVDKTKKILEEVR